MLGQLLSLALLLACLLTSTSAATVVAACPVGTYRSPNTGQCVDCPRAVTVTELQRLHYNETVKKAVLDNCPREKGETTEATTTTTKIPTSSSTADAQSSSAAPQPNTPSASMDFLTGASVVSLSLAALIVLVIAVVATAYSLKRKYQAVPRAEPTLTFSSDSETQSDRTIQIRPLPLLPSALEVVHQSNLGTQRVESSEQIGSIDEHSARSADPLPPQQQGRRVDPAEAQIGSIDEHSAGSARDINYSGRPYRGQRITSHPSTISEESGV